MTNLNHINEPLDRCFLVHATDEAYSHGFVDDRYLRFLFGLNCLFFDSITIGASDLLGNPLFYRMFKQDRDAMRILYCNSDERGEGIIQPVLMDRHESISSVAENMIKTNTIHRLPSNLELEEHARMIDDARPAYLRCSEDAFRLNYYGNMVSISEHLDGNGLKAWSQQEELFPIGSLSALTNWLTRTARKDDLRCSSIYRFADENWTGDFSARVKLLADTTYQYTSSQMQVAALSTPPEYVPIIDSLRSMSADVSYSKTGELYQNELQSEKLEVALPIKQVVDSFPLEHIIVLRKLPAFRDMRKMLTEFRLGRKQVYAPDVKHLLDECGEHLRHYISKSEIEKEDFVRGILDRDVWLTILNIVLDLDGVAISLALIAMGVPKVLAIVIGIEMVYANYRIQKPDRQAQPETIANNIIQQPIDYQGKYHPLDGTLR